MATYLAETAIKSIAIALHAGLALASTEHSYRIGYDLVRADGLGTWERAIRDTTHQTVAAYLPPEYRDLVSWATRRRSRAEGEEFRTARKNLLAILDELGARDESAGHTARDLISMLVQIRNKTKAHGAVGPDFFAKANGLYIEALHTFVSTCPAFQWQWVHVLHKSNDNYEAVSLIGESPYNIGQFDIRPFANPGIYVWPTSSRHPYPCHDLFFANAECSTFWLPNGGYTKTGRAEFIDYATGELVRREINKFLTPPAVLPASETHGLEALDVQSNVFGNLPPRPRGYVTRKLLESELNSRLRDRNHPIITLHGRGGIGKTTLALSVAHELADEADSHFDSIVWFSARDVDLRLTGPSPVRPAVVNLTSICAAYGSLFGEEGSLDAFSKVLQSPQHGASKGTLFIFDNFETIADPLELHRFLDTHTHIPNKVLITSRERAFVADYPILVQGMEMDEAVQMLRSTAKELGIQAIVTNQVIESIYEYAEGHPYVMRVLLGEIEKHQRYVAPKQLLPKRMDIVNAVFERSFNMLSEAGRRVFLTITNWRSAISELALLVVIGQRDVNVEDGVEECARMSLISPIDFADGQRAYTAPQLARVFGQKKLAGDPSRLIILDDLEILQKFGVLNLGQPVEIVQDEQIRKFITWCKAQASAPVAPQQAFLERIDRMLQLLSELWPEGWSDLAAFRIRRGVPKLEIEYALRRAVEESPSKKEALIARAQYALNAGDHDTWIADRISATELDPSDLHLLSTVAGDLIRYLGQPNVPVPPKRRRIYLASVRAQMVVSEKSLDANSLGRLAWLFYLEGDKGEATTYALRGIEKSRSCLPCITILQRLSADGVARATVALRTLS